MACQRSIAAPPAGLAASPSRQLETEPGWAPDGVDAVPVGDLSGDGFDDLFVGALFNNQGDGEPGLSQARLYLGGADGLGASPAWSIVGGPRFSDMDFWWTIDALGDRRLRRLATCPQLNR
jgi:hypothetical protein